MNKRVVLVVAGSGINAAICDALMAMSQFEVVRADNVVQLNPGPDIDDLGIRQFLSSRSPDLDRGPVKKRGKGKYKRFDEVNRNGKSR